MILGILLIVAGLALIVSVIVYGVIEMKEKTKIENLKSFFVFIFEIIIDSWSCPLLLFVIGLFLILLGVVKIFGVF